MRSKEGWKERKGRYGRDAGGMEEEEEKGFCVE